MSGCNSEEKEKKGKKKGKKKSQWEIAFWSSSRSGDDYFYSAGIEHDDRVSCGGHHGNCQTAEEPLQKMMDEYPAFAVWHTADELAQLIDVLCSEGPGVCMRIGRRKTKQRETLKDR